MSENQPNESAARTETGELKDQSPVQTTETKPEAKTESTPEGEEGKTLLTEKDDKAEVKGAPEKYEPFTPPKDWADKGWELDDKVIEAAVPLFKELGLSQAQAQKLVDFYTTTSAKAHEDTINLTLETRKGWRDEVKADAKLGGILPQVKSTIGKAIDSLGAETAKGFREAMDLTGVGDHPAFIRAFYALAQRVTEGTHVSGKGPSAFGQGKTNAAEIGPKALYPNLS